MIQNSNVQSSHWTSIFKTDRIEKMKNSISLFNITQLIRASNSLPASEPTGEYFPAIQTSISFLSAVKCECVSVSRGGGRHKSRRKQAPRVDDQNSVFKWLHLCLWDEERPEWMYLSKNCSGGHTQGCFSANYSQSQLQWAIESWNKIYS